MRYKAVCFDIDGTLYPPATLNRLMFSVILKHPVLSRRYRSIRNEFRMQQDGFDDMGINELSFREKEALMYSYIMQEKGKVLSPEKAQRQLERRYYRPLEKSFRRLSYQMETVYTLKMLKERGLRVMVLSDWPLCGKLESLGVKDYVDSAISAEEAGYLKPYRKCFEYMLDANGLNASEVLFAGDSYVKDVVGAAGAGMDAVLVNCRDADPGRGGTAGGLSKLYPLALKVFPDWYSFDEWLDKQTSD